MKNTEKKIHFFSLGNRIWQVFPASQPENWVVVQRNPDQKYASWSLLGQDLKQNIPHFSPWWWGVAHVNQAHIYLHSYQNEGLPVTEGTYCYGLEEGELLWTHPQATFEALLDEGVVLRDRNSQFLLVAPQTGNILQQAYQTGNIKREKETHQMFPHILIQGSEAFQIWEQALSLQFDLKIDFQIEQIDREEGAYLYVNEKREENIFQASLIFWPKTGTPSILFTHEVKGLGTDSFFIYEDLLGFLASPNQLGIISLT